MLSSLAPVYNYGLINSAEQQLNAAIKLPSSGFSTIAWLVVDPGKIDERFDRALGTLLTSVQLNRRSLGQLSLHGTLGLRAELWVVRLMFHYSLCSPFLGDLAAKLANAGTTPTLFFGFVVSLVH